MEIHPFEKAGLGKAPFRCELVSERRGSSCDFCGTGIRNEFWIKSADGKSFKVGCDCVRKTHAVVSGFREQRLHLARQIRHARQERKHAERVARWKTEAEQKRVEFDAQNPGVSARLLACQDASGFEASLRDSLIKWGALTPNQLAAIKRSWEQRDARANEVKVDCPEGRQTVVGEVRSIKVQESQFGVVIKMVVHDDRGFSVWVTVPNDIRDVQRGQRVRFTATLQRSDRDRSFGFGKRPTGASVLSDDIVEIRGRAA